jgi:hypothetical protein
VFPWTPASIFLAELVTSQSLFSTYPYKIETMSVETFNMMEQSLSHCAPCGVCTLNGIMARVESHPYTPSLLREDVVMDSSDDEPCDQSYDHLFDHPIDLDGLYANFLPPTDLTTQGIEPNPGWNNNNWDWEAARNSMAYGAVIGLADAYYDPQYLDEEAISNPAPPPLVGVESNPGPVVLPVKGSKVLKKLKQEMKTERKQMEKQRPKQGPARQVVREVPVAAAYSAGISTGQPRISTTKSGSKLICHKELVNIVSGTAAFTATQISLQPALGSTYQWLSTQCNGWEKYRYRKVTATYYTRTGTNVPGTVMLVPDYDAADPPPTSELQASSFHGSKDDAPWKTITLEFDMARSQELFLRAGPLAPNLDIKTYDFANMFICTTDGAAANWGKVYIEYEIELINPQTVSVGYGLGGSVIGNTGVSITSLFGTAPLIGAGSYIQSAGLPGSVNTVNLTNLTIGAEYLITVNALGSGITLSTYTTSSGLTVKNTGCNLIATGSSQPAYNCTYLCSNSNATFTGAVTGTSVTAYEFAIAPMSSATAF